MHRRNPPNDEDEENSPLILPRSNTQETTNPLDLPTEEEIKTALPKRATWFTAGMLIIADIVGAGVMSLASVSCFFFLNRKKNSRCKISKIGLCFTWLGSCSFVYYSLGLG